MLRDELGAAVRLWSLKRLARASEPIPKAVDWRKKWRRVTERRWWSWGVMVGSLLGEGFVEVEEGVADHGPSGLLGGGGDQFGPVGRLPKAFELLRVES